MISPVILYNLEILVVHTLSTNIIPQISGAKLQTPNLCSCKRLIWYEIVQVLVQRTCFE